MKPFRLFAILFILAAATVGWWVLGSVIGYRTQKVGEGLDSQVSEVWGPSLSQAHPGAMFQVNGEPERQVLEPSASKIEVTLVFDPKKRGLLWHRTYDVAFDATYTFTNPTSNTQSFHVSYVLPAKNVSLRDFRFELGEAQAKLVNAGAPNSMPKEGMMEGSIELAPGKSAPLHVTYKARGMGDWRYAFPSVSRVQNFVLTMHTNFDEIGFPTNTGSPTERLITDGGYDLTWNYMDAIAAQGIGMEMPSPLNGGPIAERVAFWAPLSLILFFGVLLLVSVMRGIDLHPVHFAFAAAGVFAFPLLFAYTVDVIAVELAFGIASLVSMALVCGYLRAVGGVFLFYVAVASQFAYMVLFSLSFFVKGLTGLALTIGGIATLAVLMVVTARVDWSAKLEGMFSGWSPRERVRRAVPADGPDSWREEIL